MTGGIKNGEQYKADGANDGEENCQAGQHLLHGGVIGHQAPAVAEPSVGCECEIEEDCGEDGAGDEEWLQIVCANIADICQCLRLAHRRVVHAVRRENPVEEEGHQCRQPEDATYDGQNPIR